MFGRRKRSRQFDLFGAEDVPPIFCGGAPREDIQTTSSDKRLRASVRDQCAPNMDHLTTGPTAV